MSLHCSSSKKYFVTILWRLYTSFVPDWSFSLYRYNIWPWLKDEDNFCHDSATNFINFYASWCIYTHFVPQWTWRLHIYTSFVPGRHFRIFASSLKNHRECVYIRHSSLHHNSSGEPSPSMIFRKKPASTERVKTIKKGNPIVCIAWISTLMWENPQTIEEHLR